MKLGEKIRYLRSVEGSLRGLGRAMTQAEVSAAMVREQKARVSQSYLSQIENGVRPHLTSTSRTLLAKFFKVHPGFLVDDPEGFHADLQSDLRTREGKLDVWLLHGAERFRNDPEVSSALMSIARQQDSRRAVVLLGAILDTPGLLDRLHDVLSSEPPSSTERPMAATSSREGARRRAPRRDR
jgi:transcriptional regulator with XRE-family HTH domain